MKKFLIVVFFITVLSGCGGNKKDIKNRFCGVHIKAQYCRCAFHNEMCEDVNMTKGEAKKYVYEQYDEWNNGGKEKWKQECTANNGVFLGNTCMKCNAGEVATDTKCVPAEEVEEEIEEDAEKIKEVDESDVDEDDGECRHDSDCDAVCEENISWKMGCNPRTNKCIKTFDTVCSADIEVFGELSFPKICSSGECIRDIEGIEKMKVELQSAKSESINDAKLTIAQRQKAQAVMEEASKNCIDGISDMTNVAIVEFATRIASLTAGGLPSLADASVDYINDAVARMSAQSDNNLAEDKKIKPDEYIVINCGLYNEFSTYLTIMSSDLDVDMDTASKVDEMLQALP